MTNRSKIDEMDTLDAGSPIKLLPTYFWVWIEMVRLWETRNHVPLNSRVDIFPMIDRYYRPKANTKKTNPSVYLSNMRSRGAIRMEHRSGSDFYYTPMVDRVLVVSGAVVFTPADLSALLNREEQFLLPHERTGAVAQTENGKVVSVGEPNGEPKLVPGPTKPKSRRTKAQELEARIRFNALHQQVWERAKPTQDGERRVLSKVELSQLVEGVNPRGVQNLRRTNRALPFEGDDTLVYIVRPSGIAQEPDSVVPVPVSDVMPMQTAGFTSLDEEQLRAMRVARLQSLGVADDLSQSLEQATQKMLLLEKEIERIREELRIACEREVDQIDRVAALETTMRNQRSIIQEDEVLRIIDWALENVGRLKELKQLFIP